MKIMTAPGIRRVFRKQYPIGQNPSHRGQLRCNDHGSTYIKLLFPDQALELIGIPVLIMIPIFLLIKIMRELLMVGIK